MPGLSEAKYFEHGLLEYAFFLLLIECAGLLRVKYCIWLELLIKEVDNVKYTQIQYVLESFPAMATSGLVSSVFYRP